VHAAELPWALSVGGVVVFMQIAAGFGMRVFAAAAMMLA
jgi:hypothetical protein